MIDTGVILGSAIVTGAGQELQVSLQDGAPGRARLALATPCELVAGDEVLVIGEAADALFVIGILRARGRSVLSFPGSLTIQAPNGAITISSGLGTRLESASAIEAEAPRLSLRAGRLEIAARRLFQKTHELFTWVSGLFQLKSGRIRAMAQGTCDVKAQSASIRADGDVKIDGESIHLG